MLANKYYLWIHTSALFDLLWLRIIANKKGVMNIRK